MNLAILSLFMATFFFVSITPGMCMTLAFSLGMSIGYRRTLWMMLGEVIGVGVVAIAAVMGIASVMLNYPLLFIILKSAGAAYLFYLGILMFQSKGKMALSGGISKVQNGRNFDLIIQGFMTAIANPKGWAFMISLLPPFIDSNRPLTQQLVLLLTIIMSFEFICMTIYAAGGKGLKRLLDHSKNIRLINRISGSLMIGVGIWLFVS